jgi:NADPH-dependent 2,4-dienoyl-CoA reductase/sulfur reductase-like enzyme
MKHSFVPRVIALAVFALAGTCAVAACGAENLPPVETDVLVVGGTAKGVAAAVAAKAEGADVFLVTPFTYLGEDMAGTLELGLPDGQKPTTALVKKLWAGASDLAAYDYWPDRKSPHPRWIYKNDWWERLS